MPTFADIQAKPRKQNTKPSFNKPRSTPATRRTAQARTRARNKQEWICDLTTVGDPRMFAGSTFRIGQQGVYNGRYIANEVTHTITGSSYTTTTKGTRTLVGY